ncbi:MAG: DUF285 domain-containing protein, partial [Bacteroidetes bacterium]|nr:DUF285 domain-containing protein [Bacteroidota bacterium]
MKKISTLKWTFMFAIMSLFVVSSAASQNFQLAPNGVTVIYTGTTPGATGIVNGKTYTAVDSAMLRDSVAAGADLTVLCTSLVTNMSELFSNKTNFNQDISSWDVSNVTNMSWMFYFATAFNKNIGKWNVANVTDMKGMFRGATAFNQDIGKWNVANVTDMNGMFYNATVFNQDLTQWCVSLIVTKPDNFDYNSELSPSNLPVWGTCPSKFILAPNGVTVIYTGNTPGATGVVNGKTYTAVNEAMLRDSVNAEADLTTRSSLICCVKYLEVIHATS